MADPASAGSSGQLTDCSCWAGFQAACRMTQRVTQLCLRLSRCPEHCLTLRCLAHEAVRTRVYRCVFCVVRLWQRHRVCMVMGLAGCLILGQRHCPHRQAVSCRPGHQRVWKQMRLQHLVANVMSCLGMCPSLMAQHQKDKRALKQIGQPISVSTDTAARVVKTLCLNSSTACLPHPGCLTNEDRKV